MILFMAILLAMLFCVTRRYFCITPHAGQFLDLNDSNEDLPSRWRPDDHSAIRPSPRGRVSFSIRTMPHKLLLRFGIVHATMT